MSFNSNDINNSINLNNYEEYFILYVDNELDRAQMEMVHAFLQTNPNLQGELDILMSTRILPDDVLFRGRQQLLADAMKAGMGDESLLLYLDEELDDAERSRFEKRLAGNQELMEEYQLLLRTKLPASELVAYPDKRELYRRSSRIRPIAGWMRVAAIFILIAGAGVLFYYSPLSKKPAQAPVAHHAKAIPAHTGQKKLPDARSLATRLEKNQRSIARRPQRPIAQQATVVSNRDEKDLATTIHKNERKRNTKHLLPQPAKTVSDDIATANHPGNLPEQNILIPSTHYDVPIVANNHASVTSSPVVRTIQEDATPVAFKDATVRNDRKGNLKSFLRKATRIIEKRAGIDPSNSNDEILIGAVAVKLN